MAVHDHCLLQSFCYNIFIQLSPGYCQGRQTSYSCYGLTCISSDLTYSTQGFGYTSVNAQLFTVIVYAFACAGVLFWARVADRTNARGLAIALSTAGGIVGYAILIGVTNNTARYVATCLVAFSMYPNTVLQLSWSAMSFVGYTRR